MIHIENAIACPYRDDNESGKYTPIKGCCDHQDNKSEFCTLYGRPIRIPNLECGRGAVISEIIGVVPSGRKIKVADVINGCKGRGIFRGVPRRLVSRILNADERFHRIEKGHYERK